MYILNGFKQPTREKPQRQIVVKQTDKSGKWTYFDGTYQGDPPICGAGGVIYLNDAHVLKFKAGVGRGTNNFAELLDLMLLFMLSAEKGAHKLQICGDSLLWSTR
jgi:ribonuclease HI